MKKIFGIVLLLLVSLTLVACDEEGVRRNPDTNCIPGYNLEDGECVYQVTEDDCDIDEMVVDNECIADPNYVPIVNDDLVGPDYQSQGYDDYAGRDIVSDECSHLDNIGEWQPVWCDEFDYEGLPNSSKWNYDVGGHGWGNNELQYYTDRIENAVVTEGHLNIIAKRENYEGAEFTSARMITYGKFDFTYGKIEVRAKLPEGVGTWPAIWMLGKSVFDSSVGWPKCGEIDIMEHVGKDQDNVHSSIHNGESSGATRFSAGKVISGVSEEFHIYSAMWYEDEIVFYVDGNQLYSYRPSIMDENYWPFYNPQFLILNIAMGGNWGGPVDENFTESSMEIDYVRIYQ